MRPVFVVLPLALLAACATPREQCISDVSRDFRVLNSLVAQTQANLARGYAVVEEQEVRTVRRSCRGRNSDGDTFRFRCDRTQTFTTTRPVAIDLAAEQSKLDGLLARQSQAKALSDQRIAQCINVHPE